MKVIIAGSRDFKSESTCLKIIDKIVKQNAIHITEVVSGTCHGPDKFGEKYAELNNLPVKPFPADWYPLGKDGPLDKTAGFRRNTEMAQYAEALIALRWNLYESKGTSHMISEANKYKLKVYIYDYDSNTNTFKYTTYAN